MKLTNLQVLNAMYALNSLSQQKMPVKLAWKITTAVRSLEPFAKAVDEPMKDIRMKFAVKDDNGNYLEAVDSDGNLLPNTVQIPTDRLTIVNKEMDELLSQIIEVHNVQFNLSDFPDSLQVEPVVMNALMIMIDDQPE